MLKPVSDKSVETGALAIFCNTHYAAEPSDAIVHRIGIPIELVERWGGAGAQRQLAAIEASGLSLSPLATLCKRSGEWVAVVDTIGPSGPSAAVTVMLGVKAR
jgi:hypothetical protein